MGNPFHYSERLTSGQARSKLRTLECQQDIPTRQRLTWVRDALAVQEDPRTRAILRQGIKRLDRCGKSARYPMFYSLQPLLDMAFGGISATSDTTNMGKHLDTLLLQLRLTTMMRSADMANIAWAMFTQDDLHFIKTTDKTGAALTFSITGDTLDTLLFYIYRHRKCPAPHMFRYLKDPASCLGSERIAKRVLACMEAGGVNTQVFKAHSLRGATATHLLKMGVQADVVRARGGWSTKKTLDTYYSRLHPCRDWQRLLSWGNAEGKPSTTCLVLAPPASQGEAGVGRQSREAKEQAQYTK